MFSRGNYIPLLLFLLPLLGQGQDCNLSIEGKVIDEGTGLPLPYVNVLVQETSQGTISSVEGLFALNEICEGEYHLTFSHIGCEDVKIHLHLHRDTSLNISLPHSDTHLGLVVIEGKKDDHSHQPSLSVNRKEIEDNPNQNLSGLIENETGVHLLKSGSGISKPIVHGLYGNRLTILNNGVIQSGQQWGNDHSPEIDPFAADKITVLKGANSIEYGGGNLGSIILVEPKRIEREPHLHGQVNYGFETNGMGHSINARVGKYNPGMSWRLNGSLKKYGDRKSADYFLNNTGIEEANLSLQLERSWNYKTFLDIYASTFNSRLGILRGSHIGNLTDLESALSSEVPFFTEQDFSYSIEAPRQEVSHHLVKVNLKSFSRDNEFFEFVLAGQFNDRKEFDVRRSGRTDIPSLSLDQFTLLTEVKYSRTFENGWRLRLGNQNIFIDNSNDPETGILPLIPDYDSQRFGWYGTLFKEFNKIQLSLGVRNDYERQMVATISSTIPREIIRYNNEFFNVSGLASLNLDLTNTQSISLNSGYAMRNPAINELYSSGLHQGVSGIEEGDIDLQTEKAFKNTLEYKWIPSPAFSLNALAYHQYFDDYIFLKPTDEVRLTIRGAFPVFGYSQTDANIYGLDLSSQITLGSSILALLKYSFLKGEDIDQDEPLIYMPPNRLYGSLTYRVKKPIRISNKGLLEETEIEVNNRLVFEQKNILPEQDFALPPSAYNLLGLKFSSNVVFPNYKFRVFVKAENLLNVKYRDYLNRQRYFADDLGLSVTTGFSFKF